MRWAALALVCVSSASAFAFDHSYAVWDKVLKANVVTTAHSSQVKYAALEKDRSGLDAFLAEVSAVKKAEYDSWSESQQLAFVINAYNAETIAWILQNHIPKSITKTGGWMSDAWKTKFFSLFGEQSALERLEGMAAGRCRVHFAFNNSTIGAPGLRAEAWLPEKLDAQFDDSIRRFVTDDSRNTFEKKFGTVEVSGLFREYKDDFAKDPACGKGPAALLHRYRPEVPPTATVKYLPWDSGLNRAP